MICLAKTDKEMKFYGQNRYEGVARGPKWRLIGKFPISLMIRGKPTALGSTAFFSLLYVGGGKHSSHRALRRGQVSNVGA